MGKQDYVVITFYLDLFLTLFCKLEKATNMFSVNSFRSESCSDARRQISEAAGSSLQFRTLY